MVMSNTFARPGPTTFTTQPAVQPAQTAPTMKPAPSPLTGTGTPWQRGTRGMDRVKMPGVRPYAGGQLQTQKIPTGVAPRSPIRRTATMPATAGGFEGAPQPQQQQEIWKNTPNPFANGGGTTQQQQQQGSVSPGQNPASPFLPGGMFNNQQPSGYDQFKTNMPMNPLVTALSNYKTGG